MAQKKIFGKVLDLIGLEESAIDEEDNYEGFDDYEDEYQDDFDDYQEEEYEEPVKKSSRKVERVNARKKIAAKTTVTILTTDTRMKWKKRIQNMQALAEMGC